MRAIAFLLAMTMAACGSEAASDSPSEAPSCADITGNYDVAVTRLGGTCPTKDTGESSHASITIAKDDDGLYVVLPGVSGGCPGTLDSSSCRFQAQCQITENGTVAVTYSVDYTFYGTDFSGSLVGAAAAGVLSADACEARAKHEGSRL
jgi:hypothetical protein